MHEMSLAESVREIVLETAQAQDVAAVRGVVLEIGELAAVETAALLFCLEAVLRGTMAEGATVVIESVPGRGRCLDCDRTVAITRLYDPCPCCGSYRVQASGGAEMRVKSLDVAAFGASG